MFKIHLQGTPLRAFVAGFLTERSGLFKIPFPVIAYLLAAVSVVIGFLRKPETLLDWVLLVGIPVLILLLNYAIALVVESMRKSVRQRFYKMVQFPFQVPAFEDYSLDDSLHLNIRWSWLTPLTISFKSKASDIRSTDLLDATEEANTLFRKKPGFSYIVDDSYKSGVVELRLTAEESLEYKTFTAKFLLLSMFAQNSMRLTDGATLSINQPQLNTQGLLTAQSIVFQSREYLDFGGDELYKLLAGVQQNVHPINSNETWTFTQRDSSTIEFIPVNQIEFEHIKLISNIFLGLHLLSSPYKPLLPTQIQVALEDNILKQATVTSKAPEILNDHELQQLATVWNAQFPLISPNRKWEIHADGLKVLIRETDNMPQRPVTPNPVMPRPVAPKFPGAS